MISNVVFLPLLTLPSNVQAATNFKHSHLFQRLVSFLSLSLSLAPSKFCLYFVRFYHHHLMFIVLVKTHLTGTHLPLQKQLHTCIKALLLITNPSGQFPPF